MLKDRARAARLRRDALNLAPVRASVLRLVDSAASRGDDVVRISWVKVDSEDVRVVNDSVLDVRPCLTAVRSLIRKIPSASVDCVRVARVNRKRFDVD